MRFLGLIFSLAIVAWLVYSYLGSGTAIDMDSDKTVVEQTQDTLNKAKDAASSLQKSMEDQAKRMEEK